MDANETRLDRLEQEAYDTSDLGLLNAISDTREVTRKFFGTKEITNQDLVKYYLARSTILNYVGRDIWDVQREFKFAARAAECMEFAASVSLE